MSDPDHRKPERDIAYEPKLRHCLMCSTHFTSEWPGERVCKRCKSTAAWRQGTS
jgi:uncharacterized paraquat-inducible protein A